MVSQRQWMYGDRSSIEFYNGVQEFCRVACEHQRISGVFGVLCPCRDCNNTRKWRDILIVEEHLLRRGFKEGYEVWFWHGEDKDRADVWPMFFENGGNDEDYDGNNVVSNEFGDSCNNPKF